MDSLVRSPAATKGAAVELGTARLSGAIVPRLRS
jgi:hypothetical protein